MLLDIVLQAGAVNQGKPVVQITNVRKPVILIATIISNVTTPKHIAMLTASCRVLYNVSGGVIAGAVMRTRPSPSADFTDYPTSALAMAFKGFVFFLFACFFGMGSTTYCTIDSDCRFAQSCCSDGVCRQTCYYCSYDYQCGTGEECCDGDCLMMCPITGPITLATVPTYTSYSCSYDYQCGTDEVCCNGDCVYSCVWTGGSIAGAVVGTVIFIAIIVAIASCCCCACCPYYHYRSTPGTVVVAGQPQYQQFVSTSHNVTQQGLVHYPPPGNYNQPPPPGYSQAPPAYPPQPAQYPPQQGPPVPQPPEPVKY